MVDAEMLKTEILKAGRGGNKEGRKAGRRDWCRVKGFASRDWRGVGLGWVVVFPAEILTNFATGERALCGSWVDHWLADEDVGGPRGGLRAGHWWSIGFPTETVGTHSWGLVDVDGEVGAEVFDGGDEGGGVCGFGDGDDALGAEEGVAAHGGAFEAGDEVFDVCAGGGDGGGEVADDAGSVVSDDGDGEGFAGGGIGGFFADGLDG